MKENNMETYIYVLKLIERLWEDSKWTQADEDIAARHFEKLKADHENGLVIMAGRTERTDMTGFGIVVFKAVDSESAQNYMLDDPAVKEGIMTAEVQRYHLAII